MIIFFQDFILKPLIYDNNGLAYESPKCCIPYDQIWFNITSYIRILFQVLNSCLLYRNQKSFFQIISNVDVFSGYAISRIIWNRGATLVNEIYIAIYIKTE